MRRKADEHRCGLRGPSLDERSGLYQHIEMSPTFHAALKMLGLERPEEWPVVQADHRQRRFRAGFQGSPLRRLHPATPLHRGTAQAARVEDTRAQVQPTLDPQG